MEGTREVMSYHKVMTNWLRLICLITALARAFPLANAQSPRISSVQQLTIEDSNGKTIGRIIGGVGLNNIESVGASNLAIRAVVLLRIDQLVLPVAVSRERFYGGGALYYQSENCVGSTFFPTLTSTSEPSNLVPRVAVGTPGQTVYFQPASAEPTQTTIKSISQGVDGCINQTFNNVSAVLAQPLIDLSTVFTPPFTLKAAP